MIKRKVRTVRQSARIRAYLVEHGYTQAEIARHLSMAPGLVSETITGARNNRRVLNTLVDLGVPVEFLALPCDMQA